MLVSSPGFGEEVGDSAAPPAPAPPPSPPGVSMLTTLVVGGIILYFIFGNPFEPLPEHGRK